MSRGDGKGFTEAVPWQLKIPAKVVLSRLPIPESLRRRLPIFRHGAMQEPGYALRIFRRHLERSGLLPEPSLRALDEALGSVAEPQETPSAPHEAASPHGTRDAPDEAASPHGTCGASPVPASREGTCGAPNVARPSGSTGRSAPQTKRAEPPVRSPQDLTILEIGPGEAVTSAVISAALGVGRIHLVDRGAFARTNPEALRVLSARLQRPGLHPPDVAPQTSFDRVLSLCRARYYTGGLASLRELPDQSIDFLWSNAVLEHIRLEELRPMLMETRRILRPHGCASHDVDFRDHLGGALNHLRFAPCIWEWDFLARSGFYTNRVGFGEMCDRFRAAGFDVEALEVNRWPALPTPRRALAPPFRSRSDEDLRITSASFLLRPLPGAGTIPS